MIISTQIKAFNSTPTYKQRLGRWLIPKLPVTRHVFNHFRLELNALRVRLMHLYNPSVRGIVKQLKQQKSLLVNVGCGPFGKVDWVNFDIFPHKNVTVAADTRKALPLADGSCSGVHVEHFLEHLDPLDERPHFLRDCARCLQQGGVLRVIVPDAELYVRAYLAEGWDFFNTVGCGGDQPEKTFKTKMQALNHVFLQDWEHYGGYDFETLRLEVKAAGFSDIKRCQWQVGDFPQGCIDREQHRPYSLYLEAKK